MPRSSITRALPHNTIFHSGPPNANRIPSARRRVHVYARPTNETSDAASDSGIAASSFLGEILMAGSTGNLAAVRHTMKLEPFAKASLLMQLAYPYGRAPPRTHLRGQAGNAPLGQLRRRRVVARKEGTRNELGKTSNIDACLTDGASRGRAGLRGSDGSTSDGSAKDSSLRDASRNGETGSDGGIKDLARDASGDTETGSDGSGANCSSTRAPLNHRPASSACPQQRAPISPEASTCTAQPIVGLDGSACGACSEDSDCTAGPNGRCGNFGPIAYMACSYDDCFDDSECEGGAPCECRPSSASAAANARLMGAIAASTATAAPVDTARPASLTISANVPAPHYAWIPERAFRRALPALASVGTVAVTATFAIPDATRASTIAIVATRGPAITTL
jgi:hypothetical protein